MEVSVSEAKGVLTDLVRRAEEGDEVVLTRHGRAVARLESIHAKARAPDRRALMNALRASAGKADGGQPAARSQDFLYGEDGLPE
jgi:prevent-host-death family protein